MPDRRFIFSTDGFRRAFEGMLDGFRGRRGILLLTGPSGCGKTTLLQALQEEIQRDGAIVFVRFHPEITGDLLTSCLAELGSREIPTDESARVRALIDLVKLGTRAGGPPAVLVIDEAGQFSDAQLIDLYRLAAPGHPVSNALQFVLAALPMFEQRLQQNGLAPLQQVIGHRARLQPLSEEELSGYIAHRCSIAGLTAPDLFEKAAVKRVYEITRGTPRLVNRLCSGALFIARERQSEIISAEIIDEAATGCELAGTPVARPAEAPLPSPDKKATPAEAAVPQPAAAASQQPKPQTVQAARARMPAAATPDALALAEAERAWVKAILPPIAETPAKQPAPIATPRAPTPVPPPGVLELTQPAPPATARVPTPAAAPAVLELTQPAPPTPTAAPAVLELTQPAPPVLELSNPIDEAAPAVAARRRLPALRIAASIALLATSAVALGLWYRSTGDHAVMASAEPAAPEISRSAAAETRAPAVSASDAAEAPAPVEPSAMAARAAPEPAPAAAEPVSQPPVIIASSDAPPPAVQVAAATEPVAPSEPAAPVTRTAETVLTPPPVVEAETPAPEPQQLAQASQPVAVESPSPATPVVEVETQSQAEPPPAPSAEAQPQQVAQAPEAAAVEAPATMADATPQAEPRSAVLPQQLAPPPAAMEPPAPATTVAEAQPQSDVPPVMPEAQAPTQADVRPEPTEIAVADAIAPQPAAIEPAAGREAAAPIADPLRSDPATAETMGEPPPAEPARSAIPPPATPAPTPEPSPAQAAAPTQTVAAEPPQQTAQVGAAPAVPPVDGSSNAAELSQLMARGDEMMRIGDPASARLFYERAAARGLAKGFTAVGRTYDPTVLRQLNIRGGGANGERALEWYRRGADAGDTEAGRIASDLSAWLAIPR